MADVLETIRHCRAIRRFSPQQVDEAALQQVLEAGLWAPSAGGRQGVLFAVSQDRAVNERLGRIKRANSHPHMATKTSYVSREQPSIADDARIVDAFYGAPTVVTLFAPKNFLFAAEDCAAAAQLDEGYKNCRFSCLGLGNCTRVCPTGALTIQNGLAVIDHELCINCGKCVAACPRGIIRMVPADSKIRLLCRAQTKGKEVREACQVGCIGCGLCARTCKFGALTMVNDLPVCDFDKCVGCMECARKCPRQCLWADFEHAQVAFINPDKCTGCDDCAQVCKFSAIEGEPMATHAVLRDRCVGCGECDRACQPDAVVMTRQK